jgi:hypothetical protein
MSDTLGIKDMGGGVYKIGCCSACGLPACHGGCEGIPRNHGGSEDVPDPPCRIFWAQTKNFDGHVYPGICSRFCFDTNTYDTFTLSTYATLGPFFFLLKATDGDTTFVGGSGGGGNVYTVTAPANHFLFVDASVDVTFPTTAVTLTAGAATYTWIANGLVSDAPGFNTLPLGGVITTAMLAALGWIDSDGFARLKVCGNGFGCANAVFSCEDIP